MQSAPPAASYQPAPSYQPPAPERPSHSGLTWAAYVTAVLIPLIGFILGIVLVTKNRVGRGVGAMVLSICVAAAIFSATMNEAANQIDRAVTEMEQSMDVDSDGDGWADGIDTRPFNPNRY